jgi:hypothetical protein
MEKMTIPDDWVLLEAAKRSETWCRRIEWLIDLYQASGSFRALCDMIQKYEKQPVDRKLLCAQEAWRLHDEDLDSVTISVRAIELWEEGFGK